MTAFQIVLLGIVMAFLVLTIAAGARRWVSLKSMALGIVVLCLAAVAVTWPDLTTRCARAVGISSGSNLLLYCTVVVMCSGFLMVYVRLRRLRRELTLLVRELALRDAGKV
jgi:hypothetical protein